MKVKRELNSFYALTSAIVLTAGVFLAVLLVRSKQELREKAFEIGFRRITVCHKKMDASDIWLQTQINENTLDVHLDHGDFVGSCPHHINSLESSEIESKIALNNTFIPYDNTNDKKQYLYDTTQFTFGISFQGGEASALPVNEKKRVRLIFKNLNEEYTVYTNIEVKNSGDGLYKGLINDIQPGKYEVFIKAEGYLERKFVNVNLKANEKNIFLWKDNDLLFGDFNHDNVIDSFDAADLLALIANNVNPVTDNTRIFDVSKNGNIDKDDLRVLLDNYKELEVSGEK